MTNICFVRWGSHAHSLGLRILSCVVAYFAFDDSSFFGCRPFAREVAFCLHACRRALDVGFRPPDLLLHTFQTKPKNKSRL